MVNDAFSYAAQERLIRAGFVFISSHFLKRGAGGVVRIWRNGIDLTFRVSRPLKADLDGTLEADYADESEALAMALTLARLLGEALEDPGDAVTRDGTAMGDISAGDQVCVSGMTVKRCGISKPNGVAVHDALHGSAISVLVGGTKQIVGTLVTMANGHVKRR